MNIYADKNITQALCNYAKVGTYDSDSKSDAFRKGWEACLLYQQKEAILKQDRKDKKLIIGDFVDWRKERYFLTGFYCDNGFKVATTGTYLIKIKADYPAEWEGKIVNPENEEFIEGTFPKYEKVIPDVNEMIESTLTLEDLKIIHSCDRSKSAEKLSHNFVNIIDEVGFSMLSIDRFIKFWEAIPDAKLYHFEDKRKAWMLISGDNKFVAMPLCDYVSANFKYITEEKSIVKAA